MIELAAFCGRVLPGVKSVEYAPIAWVDRESYNKLITSTHNWQFEIPFLHGGWMKAPIFPFGDLINEQNKQSTAGSYWEVDVSGRTLKMQPTSTGTLAEMSCHRFLLRITTKDGTPWIVGSLEAPLSFVYQAAIDGSKNQYDIKWSAKIPHPMYGYKPTL